MGSFVVKVLPLRVAAKLWQQAGLGFESRRNLSTFVKSIKT